MKEKLIQWAKDRNLIRKENHTKQILKLVEEVGELSSAILKGNKAETKDAIGDIGAVMYILSEQLGYDFDDCIKDAYKVIKNRKGKTENGIFIKES